MQFLCEGMKIDCEIDCDARGRRLKSCLALHEKWDFRQYAAL